MGNLGIYAIHTKKYIQHLTTEEIKYFISNIDLKPEEVLKISRAHWSIEVLHNLLDIVFNEDKCQIKSTNGQVSFNCLRKISIFHHHKYKEETKNADQCYTNNMESCLMNNEFLWNFTQSIVQ